MKSIIKIHPLDNVGVALRDLAGGEQIEIAGQWLTLASPLPRA